MIGDRIAELRRAQGWDQSELARRAGVRQPSLSRIETGARRNPNAETMRRIARALGVSVDDLYPQTQEAVA